MAIPGRKPKAENQRRHRGAPAHEWVEVVNVPFEGAPKLPARRCNGRAWSPRTRAKWKAWSTMPHCSMWRPSDWSFALDTIELAAMVHEGDARYATELRNREKVLATTFDALRDQRIRYVDVVENDQLAAVADIVSYRDL